TINWTTKNQKANDQKYSQACGVDNSRRVSLFMQRMSKTDGTTCEHFAWRKQISADAGAGDEARLDGNQQTESDAGGFQGQSRAAGFLCHLVRTVPRGDAEVGEAAAAIR